MVSPQNLKKILFIFDFDHTIVDKNSDTHIFKLFPGGKLPQLLENAYENGKWTEFMQKVLNSLGNSGQTPENFKNFLQKLELTQGFSGLFAFLRDFPAESLIVSDANRLFIDWILEKHGLKGDFKEIFTNPAEIRENFISLSPFHSHECASCPTNMCKGKIVRDFLGKNQGVYGKIAYVGDGSNDFCPLELLGKGDIAFYRKDFALEKKIKEFGEKLACEKKGWESGEEIVEFVKEFMEKDKFY